MNPNITFAPRPGNCRGVIRFSLLIVALLGLFAIAVGALLGGCKAADRTQAIQAASVVPAPSVEFGTTIRTRTAAVVKAEVLRHPYLAMWANGAAKVAFAFSGVKLPDPGTIKGELTLAGYFVPSAYQSGYGELADKIEALYSADFPAAVASQAAGAPYLTLLGEGIQDGIKQAQAAAKVATVISAARVAVISIDACQEAYHRRQH